jgi:hypothetical protein
MADISDQDAVSLAATNVMVQQGNGMVLTETVQNPSPNAWETSWYDITLNKLDGSSLVTLSDSYIPNAPGDQTFAFQWNTNLAAGQTFSITLTKSIRPVPIRLSIALFGASVLLQWPTNYTSDFVLQSASGLGSGSWAAVTNSHVVSNGLFQVTLPISGNAQFYRLKK